jgi:riboflavin synthase
VFTGIVQAVGIVDDIKQHDGACELSITTPDHFLANVKTGDSICVQGICLTVVSFNENIFKADVSTETIRCTSLDQLAKRSKVNLELALTLSDHLGGHLVTGHVDGVGTVKSLEQESNSTRITVCAPVDIARFIARKGSICMDGVSLTVNDVEANNFSINIIPHTLENTAIIEYQKNTRVNLEIDLIARYVERLHTYTNS